jgi:DNA-binding MarR family transcriptional regulator
VDERANIPFATSLFDGWFRNNTGAAQEGRRMGLKLKDEIRQNKPFSSPEQEALLNIQRTASLLQHRIQQILKPYELTAAQYNVLRILRGAGQEGLRCSEIGERMINNDPDVTRLLTRLQRMHLVDRRRDLVDRRVIHSRISAEGLKCLKELDPVVEESSKSLFSHICPERMRLLIGLLEEVRQGFTV